MRIRPETPEEFPLLYDFVQRAFATARVCDGDEQDYAARLRAGDAYIPALALVAEEGGRIIGHVLFTRLAVRWADGREQPALLLGPLSVALEHRSRGVGAGLGAGGLPPGGGPRPQRRLSRRRSRLLRTLRLSTRRRLRHRQHERISPTPTSWPAN